ncbi:copper-binding protein [Mycobacterium tuberculosis]|jgi:Cu/Ag efflux protein CusF|nr:copper-binding protein [Mycobacterium tuberculosis]
MMILAIGIHEAGAAPVDANMQASQATSLHVRPNGSGPYSSGQVQRIDWDQGKVLIAHGPIENLGMPSMTMLFRVSERSQLKNLNTGDKVQFRAEKTNGTLFIVEIVRQ